MEDAYGEYGIKINKVGDETMTITFDGYEGDPNFPKVFQLEVDPTPSPFGPTENERAAAMQQALESWINHVMTTVDGKAELMAKNKGFSGQSKTVAKTGGLTKPPSSLKDSDLTKCIKGRQYDRISGEQYLCR